MVTQRVIGQLEEFKDWATTEFQHLHNGQVLILNKIEKLNEARWTLYGKLTAVNGVLVLLFELFAHKIFN